MEKMEKIGLDFIELHRPLFMQGVNLGTKINAAQRKATLVFQPAIGVVWIKFNGKISFIPLSNVASADANPETAEFEDGLQGTTTALPKAEAPQPKPRGRPPKAQAVTPGDIGSDPSAPYDPNDPVQAAAHKQAVRDASRNANRSPAIIQNDALIQQARNTAMKLKSAQVEVPTRPTNGRTGLEGKRKIISHAELAVQQAAEKATK